MRINSPAPTYTKQVQNDVQNSNADIQTPEAGAEQAEETKGKGKGKGRGGGRPDWAGGPNNASALPPGLEGKELPPGNPWSKVAENIEAEKAEAAEGEEAVAEGELTAEDEALAAAIYAASIQSEQPQEADGMMAQIMVSLEEMMAMVGETPASMQIA